MGLLVWLPLNGNLNNNGLSSGTAVITSSGATVNNNGKIGKTYLFDANDDYISIDSDKLRNCFKGGANPFTIAMWIYNTKTTGARGIPFGDYSLSGTIGFNLELNSSGGSYNDDIRFYWNGSPDYRATNTNIAPNTWVHLTIVYDGEKVDFYRNGILVNTRTGTLADRNKTAGVFYLGRDGRTGGTAFGGYLNDFRVYDTALSKKQIREIAKGLACHYKLDAPKGNPNLLGKKDYWWGGNTANATVSNYVVTMTCASQWAGITPNANILKSGGDFVLSYKFKKINGILKSIGGHLGSGVSVSKWTLDGVIQTTTYSSPLYISDDENVHEIVVYLSPTAETDGIIWIQPNRAVEDSVTVKVWDLKIENGNKKTSWVPNVSDDLYNSYDKLLLTDVSGNGHTATKTGTLTFDTNTPRYSGSTKFDLARINSPAGAVLATSKDFTINGWFYHISGTTYYASAESYNTSICLEDTRFFIYPASGGAYVGYWSATNNIWQMITLVHNSVSKTLTLYVNGVQTGQIITDGTVYANNTLNIGGRQNGAQFNGFMSDFRIYSTALSANDILTLYKDCGIIDKKNGVYAYEFKEE